MQAVSRLSQPRVTKIIRRAKDLETKMPLLKKLNKRAVNKSISSIIFKDQAGLAFFLFMPLGLETPIEGVSKECENQAFVKISQC